MRDVEEPIDETTPPIPAGIVGAGRIVTVFGPFLTSFLKRPVLL